ncbi:hypothetical protein EDD16DRAFT_1543918, partial [Pisolithus croceorrhizus]
CLSSSQQGLTSLLFYSTPRLQQFSFSSHPPSRRSQTSLLALPKGWEKRYTAADRPYFVDHVSRRTTWVDPAGWEVRHTPTGQRYFDPRSSMELRRLTNVA